MHPTSDSAAMGNPNILRVFVVDDIPAARAGLSAFLNSLEDTEVVGSAADGAAALEGISETPLHVAIMDIEMPRMDGLEAIRQLRARGNTIPIIAMSIGWEFRDRALTAGANAFIYKGESLTELTTLLDSFRPDTPETRGEVTNGDTNPPITIIELETAYGLMDRDHE